MYWQRLRCFYLVCLVTTGMLCVSGCRHEPDKSLLRKNSESSYRDAHEQREVRERIRSVLSDDASTGSTLSSSNKRTEYDIYTTNVTFLPLEIVWYSECSKLFADTVQSYVKRVEAMLHRIWRRVHLVFVSCEASRLLASTHKNSKTYDVAINSDDSFQVMLQQMSSTGVLKDFFSPKAKKVIVTTANHRYPQFHNTLLRYLESQFVELGLWSYFGLYDGREMTASEIHSGYTKVAQALGGEFFDLRSRQWHDELFAAMVSYSLVNEFRVSYPIKSISSVSVAGVEIDSEDISFVDRMVIIDRSALISGAEVRISYEIQR